MKKTDISNRLNEMFEMRLGRILKISQQHGKKDSDKRLWAKIELFPSGTHENVPFWGGGIDFDTNMPHGVFCPPRENQTVIIFFLNGNFSNPVAAFPVPHPYDFSFVEKYYDIVENVNDISVFHFSGSRIILREDGSIDIQKRIEESTDVFVNHTLKIEFEYDDINDIRKKTITDIDNNIKIELTTDDVKITDSKDQIFNMHHKTGEEKIVLQKTAAQKIEMNAAGTDIKHDLLLNLLGATESFLKGTTWGVNWGTFNTSVQAATPGNEAANAQAITDIQSAFSTFAGQLAAMLSLKIKGE